MKKKIYIGLFILSLPIFGSGAKAQLIWQVCHSDKWMSDTSLVDSSICFTSVSCSGNNCTAAARIQLGSQFIGPIPLNILFYHSTDGGLSWNPQLPPDSLPPFLCNDGITTIQQIDSLNVVGIGDLGTVVRTFDGGNTWEKQTIATRNKLEDVHFSDPMKGIIAVADSAKNIFTTTDGGRHWDVAPFARDYLWQCHSYGNGRFRLFQYWYGTTYETKDNFKTVDSTSMVFDSTKDPKWYRNGLTRCTFGTGDTILAYGAHNTSDTSNGWGDEGLIIRTLDGGKHWEQPAIFPRLKIAAVLKCTSPDNDTVFAAGGYNNNFVISTDHGKSWQADSILIDTTYDPVICFGIALPANGHPIASFSFTTVPLQSLLVQASSQPSRVEYTEYIIDNTHIYPNPSSGKVTISSIDVSRPIQIIDILGREVYRGSLSDMGNLTLNVSSFSPGIYEVLIDHFGQRFTIGKLAVVGK